MAIERRFPTTLREIWARRAATIVPTPPVVGVPYRSPDADPEIFARGQEYNVIYDSAYWNEYVFELSVLADAAARFGVGPWYSGQSYEMYSRCLGPDGKIYFSLRQIQANEDPVAVPGKDASTWQLDTLQDSPGHWYSFVDYGVPVLKFAQDGNLYISLQPSGPTTRDAEGAIVGPKEPTAEKEYWKKFAGGGSTIEGNTVIVPGYLSELRWFYERTPPTGWLYCNGASYQNATTLYPELMQILLSPNFAWKVITMQQWETQSNSVGGTGGVGFFGYTSVNDTLRLPDLRGDSIVSVGRTITNSGEWQNESINSVLIGGKGQVQTLNSYRGIFGNASGAFYTSGSAWSVPGETGQYAPWLYIDIARSVVPGDEVRSRRVGLLPCVCVKPII